MKKKLVITFLAFALTFIVFSCFVSEVVAADKPIVWKVQGFTPAGTLYDTWGKHFAGLVEELSGGRIKIEWFPSGTIVSALEAPDAVGDGILDAEYGYSGLWSGHNEAFPLFCSTPGLFSDPWDAALWMKEGGGEELWNEMLEPYNCHGIIVGIHHSETFLWSNKPIRTVEDMKGLKLRMMPVMGKVLEEHGMSVVFMSGGEIIPSLEKKVLDAAEYSIPAFDKTLGFQDVCKYFHFPGIHQPSAMQEIVINKDKWEALPDDLKRIVEYAAQLNIFYCYSQSALLNVKAIEEFEKMGLEKVVLEKEAVETLTRWANEWFEKHQNENPWMAKIRESQKAFGKMYFPYKKSLESPYPDWAFED